MQLLTTIMYPKCPFFPVHDDVFFIFQLVAVTPLITATAIAGAAFVGYDDPIPAPSQQIKRAAQKNKKKMSYTAGKPVAMPVGCM